MSRAKRCFDIVASLIGLALTWPLFLLAAALIKLDDGGPVFFRQERVGCRGRPFRIWKFRTMRVSREPGLPITPSDDARITRVGRWLRRCKIDELPQLLNVLAGEMSMVGPRPEVPKYVALYTPEQRRVLELVPGITDPASLRFLHEGELLARAADPERTYLHEVLPQKIRLQLDYALDATVGKDVLVMVDTLRHLLPQVRPLVVPRLLPYRRPLIVLLHALLIALGYRAAFELRFDFAVPPEEVRRFWVTLPWLLGIRLVTYSAFRAFRGHWQHFGITDAVRLGQLVTLSSIVFVVVLAATGQFPGVPRSVLLLDWAGAIFLTGMLRVAGRSLREVDPFPRLTGRRTLIVGAGDKAERLLREVRRDPHHALRVIGVVAEDARVPDGAPHGFRVLGTVDDLPAVVARHHIAFIVIALDAPTGAEMETVVDRCLATGVEFKTLPSLRELLDGSARADQLRTVRIEDLLGREPVSLDLDRVEADLRGRVVLVTGGAGSIGSELAREIARAEPARLILVDQAESPLYFVQLELTMAHPHLDVVPVICDVTDEGRVAEIFDRFQPEYVVHAAAYKHVPMMEENLAEAVRNNVFGTLIVAEAAARGGVRKFVLISTDKAVNPTSVMGATKRIAERIVLGLPSLRASGTEFRAVRFGNVLGSTGSVVPLFKQQLEGGGPLTVTHPEVERYFMTIPEAAQLVLQAAALQEAGGRIAMLDMGRPVRILDLAEKLVRLAGLEPHRDVRIVFTGLRPGEKLHEELVSAVEQTVPSVVEKIRIVQRVETGVGLVEGLHGLAAALATADTDQLLAHIRALVPECSLRARARRPRPLVRPGSALRRPLSVDPQAS